MTRRRSFTAPAVAFGALASVVAPQAARAEGTRAEVPIRQMVLPNGDVRYSVPVSVGGGAPVDALLDTGSFGVRAMKAALGSARYESTGVRRSFMYGGGAEFTGDLSRAAVAVGDARTDGPVVFQVIDKASCTAQRPRCPAARLGPKDYRIAGDGYAGQGFDAILGISLRKAQQSDTAAANPLSGIGDGSWIVELPQPGAGAPGRLIVNPSADERSGFRTLALTRQTEGGGEGGPGWLDGAISGCLIDEATQKQTCGLTLLDTGAPGLEVAAASASAPTAWAAGTRAILRLTSGGETIDMPFTVGADASTAVHVHPPARSGGPDRISAGTLPFLAFTVLYDARNGTIGFRPRDDARR